MRDRPDAAGEVLRVQVELTAFGDRTAHRPGRRSMRPRRPQRAARPHADAPLGDPEPPDVRIERAPLPSMIGAPCAPGPTGGSARADRREASGVAAAELGYLPDFEVSVGRFLNYERSDGFGAMASVTLPFAHLDKYQAAFVGAGADQPGAERRCAACKDGVHRGVARATRRGQRRRGSNTSWRAARTCRTTGGEGQRGGRQQRTVEFASLLDALRTMQETHLQHAQASAAYQRAESRICNARSARPSAVAAE
ncbi:MAG: hypothetical protein U0802_23330 [Candidatus Binatia bacterium]